MPTNDESDSSDFHEASAANSICLIDIRHISRLPHRSFKVIRAALALALLAANVDAPSVAPSSKLPSPAWRV